MRGWLSRASRGSHEEGRFTEEQMVTILREADGAGGGGGQAARHQRADDLHVAQAVRDARPADVKRLRQLEDENARLKKLVAERDLEIEVMKEISRKKMVSVPARRRQVAYARQRGVSQRRACTLLSVARSALGYRVAHGGEGRARGGGMSELVGAVSALRLSAHPHLSRPRRSRDERRSGPSAVAPGGPAGAAETAAKAHCDGPAAAAAADAGEPGVVLRLRVRRVRQRSAAQVPDRDRRVSPRRAWPSTSTGASAPAA